MKSRKQNIILTIALIFMAWLPAFNLFAQTVEVTAAIDTASIRIGDPVKLRLTARYHAGKSEPKIKWPEFKDTITGMIEIIDRSKIEKIPGKDEPMTFVQEQTYTITSFDSGYHAIPPFRFVINGDTSNILETEPLLLEVQTVAVDTSLAIRDIKGVMEQPFTWKEALPYIIGGVAVLALIGGIIWFINKKKKNQPLVTAKPKVVIPPHITALQSLEQLRSEKLWQEGKVKQYHSALSDILRQYIEERFRVNALEQTTDEILIAFRNVVVDNESKMRLKQVLTLADLVKFAKEQPLPQENEMSLNNAFDFVNGTKREEPKQDINDIKQ